MKAVTLYTKEGCHLCEQALDLLNQVRRRHPFELELVDILDDPAAYDRYKHDVPVVMLNGREVARHRVTPEQLIAHLSTPA
jgi:glutaredoxin